MALNFLGLGFSLGAEDKGLGKAIKETSTGLADISASVIGIGLASAKMILRPPNFKPAISAINTLSNDVKVSTNMIDQFGASSGKATSAGLAGLNLTDKEFKKAQGTISSTAFSMNTDVGAVTKSMVALKQSSVDVKKVGFKSFKEYQKFIEVTGTDSVKFASAIGKMNHQMGMTPEMTEDVIKSVTAIGRKFNIGREAIAGMSDTVEMLNENSNLLPQNWSPDKMSKFIKGTTIVAGALTKVGYSADEAIGASKGLAQALLKGRAGMAGLYSGLEDDIPAITDVLTQNLGSIDHAVKKLEESPDEFMASMGKLVDDVNKMNLDPDALNRFRIQMEKQFGPAAMAVFTKKGFGQIGPAIKEAQKPIEDQAKILTTIASKHRDGRVAADHFAIAQARLAEGMKHVKGVMSDQEFLGKYKKGTTDVLATLNKFAAKGGVVGKATQMMVNFHNHGIGGTLGAMHPLGLATLEMVKQFGPIAQALPGLTMAFKALASPIVLVVGGIAALAFAFKDLAKGENSIIRPFIDRAIKDAPKFFAKAKEIFQKAAAVIFTVLKQINWAAIGQAVIDGFTFVFNGIFSVIEMIDWNKVGNFLGNALKAAVEFAISLAFKAIDLIGKFIDWFTSLDWGKIGNWLGQAFTALMGLVIDAIVMVIKKIPDIFMMILDFVIGFIDGIQEALSKAFPRWAAAFEVFFTILKVVAVPVLIAVAGHFTLLGVRAVYSAVTSAAAWVKASLEIAANLGMIMFLMIKIGARYVWLAAEAVASGLAMGVSAMAAGIKMAAAWVIGLGPIAWIIAAIVGLGVVIYAFGDKILSFLSGIWEGIKGAARTALNAIKSFFLAPIEAIKSAWSKVTGFFSGILDGIKGAASSAWSWIKDKAKGAVGAITGAWSGDGGGKGVADVVNDAMAKVKATTDQINKDLAKSSQDAVKGVQETTSGTAGNVVNALMDAGKQTIGAAMTIATEVGKFVTMTDQHLGKAAALVFPKLSGDPLLEIAEQYNKLHVRENVLMDMKRAGHQLSVKEAEELTRIQEEQDRMNTESMDKFGKSAASISMGAKMATAGFEKLGEHMSQMSIEQRDALQQQIDLSASRYAKEYLDIARRKKILADDTARRIIEIKSEATTRGQVLDDEVVEQMATNQQLTSLYDKQMQDMERSQAATIAKLTTQADQLSAGYHGVTMGMGMDSAVLSKKVIKDWDKWNKEIEATTSTMVINFKIASTNAAKGFAPGSDIGKAVADTFDKLNSKYANSMQLLRDSGKIGPELKKAMDEVTVAHEKQLTKLAEQAKKLREETSDPTIQNNMLNQFKKSSEETGKVLEKKSKQIATTNTMVTESFKLNAGEAADSVARIAVINPDDFKRGIKTIRETTIKFLEDLDKTGVKLLKDIDTNIKKYFDSSTKGWNDQQALIKTFSEKAALHIQTYWTKAIDEANRAVTGFVQLSKTIDAGLTSMAKSINLMDLLASPSQITAWAAAVVSALATAFRGGAAADAMISAAYTEALTQASEIASKADAARPDASEAKGAPRNTSSAMQATLSLERSINHPAWASDKDEPIPAALQMMNDNLANLLAAMADFANGKPVAPPPKSPPRLPR